VLPSLRRTRGGGGGAYDDRHNQIFSRGTFIRTSHAEVGHETDYHTTKNNLEGGKLKIKNHGYGRRQYRGDATFFFFIIFINYFYKLFFPYRTNILVAPGTMKNGPRITARILADWLCPASSFPDTRFFCRFRDAVSMILRQCYLPARSIFTAPVNAGA
jgi:hypothetical protein